MTARLAALAIGLALASQSALAQQAQAPAKRNPIGQTAVCVDIPNSWPVRSKITGDHIKYIDSIKDKILIGGPVRGGADGLPTGSLIVYKTESLDEAKKLLADDPFSKGNLFAKCEWHAFVQYVGTYVGGWAQPQ